MSTEHPLIRAVSEEARVTPIELFFDLVFVFSLTQVVALLHGHVDARSAGSALLVFWLVRLPTPV